MLRRRYSRINQIGSGGMGTVWLVLDRFTGQEVALKTVERSSQQIALGTRIADSNLNSDAFGRQLQMALAREFQLLASLLHPNIVHVLDYGFNETGAPYFTMEYLPNAADILEASQAATLSTKIEMITQMLRALTYLHRRGVLHRDLKPSNVLVVIEDGKPLVKMLDFGLSIEAHYHSEQSGTILYMAPEVILNEQAVDARADQYAIGVIAYQMLSGVHPFMGESLDITINNVLSVQPDMDKLEASAAVKLVIHKMLSKNPVDRYQTSAEALNALANASDQPIPLETEATRESYLQAARFVGREIELLTLVNALEQAIRGRGSAWLVAGESGVGKSRLVHELCTVALVQGILVMRDSGASEVNTSYQGWQNLLRWLTVMVDVSDEEAALFKTVIPDIETLLGREVTNIDFVDATTLQQKFTEAVHTVLMRLKRPIVLVVDDLQWVGQESVNLLASLCAQARTSSMLLICNLRTDEAPHIGDRLTRSGANVLTLTALHEPEIAILSESILGSNGREERLVRFLTDQTEGNPFFLVEVLRLLAQESGNLGNIRPYDLPTQVVTGGMRQVIERRLNLVPVQHRSALEYAAAMGRTINMPLLRQLLPAVDFDQWLVDCIDAAILSNNSNQLQFTHDKLREVIQENTAPLMWQRIHWDIASALENLYKDKTDQYTAELAYHWGQANNPDKEINYAMQAGDLALRLQVNHQARGFYDQVLRALDRLTLTPTKRLMRIDAQIKRAECSITAENPHLNLSRLIEAEMLLNVLMRQQQHIQLSSEELMRLMRLHIVMGRILYNTTQYQQAIFHFNQLEHYANLADNIVMQNAAQGMIGRVLVLQGYLKEGLAKLEAANAILLADKYWTYGLTNQGFIALALCLMGRKEEAQAMLEGVLKKAKELDNTPLLILLYAIGVLLAWQWEDKRMLDRYVAWTIETATPSNELSVLYLALTFQAWGASQGKNIELAARLMSEAKYVASKVGERLLAADWLQVAFADINLHNGKPQLALEEAQTAIHMARQVDSLIGEGIAQHIKALALAKLDSDDLRNIQGALQNSYRQLSNSGALLPLERTLESASQLGISIVDEQLS